MDILKDLNQKQQEAVIHTDGPLLIIAGAGSGKTKTLTHRIAYLIREKGVSPHGILAVTFTNKAAAEMKERIKSLLDGKIQLPFMGTFHSICVRILRSEYRNLEIPSGFLIYDSADQASIIKEAIKEAGVSADQFKPGSVLAGISSAKNKFKSPQDFIESADGYYESIIAKCYEIYQEKLNKAGALDFDDLIMKTALLFKNNAEVLRKYQNIFKHVLVDEYQDTNHAQYLLTNFLSQKHKNICVVGDDWQSIYKWRGADISNILEFEKDYPDAKVILLEQNYRSSQNILDGSHGVISKNINRKEKKLFSSKDKGDAIAIVKVPSEREEGKFIVNKIQEIIANDPMRNLKYNDFAILYRTNAQSRSLEEAFLAAGIPYRIVGGLKFYARKEIKDILAYLRLVLNPKDKVSISRIINIPIRGIGETTLKKVLDAVESGADLSAIDGLNEGKQKAVNSFFRLLDKTREQLANKDFSLSKIIDFILMASGYDKHIQSDKDAEARWENIQELFTAAEKFNSLPAEEALKRFLEEVALVADTDEIESTGNVVNLMTLHSSKGLEFNTVFLAGMEEGILPHSRSVNAANQEDLEEERRLCYVGMTRAKERLFLIHAQIRKIYGSSVCSSPSRFIYDIPKDLVENVDFSDSFGDDTIA